MNELKRMAAIHDLSGLGKCSLTVALPIVSASGVECCCIPTALLSTHTGGFEGWTFRDLSEDIVPIASHWNELNVRFDAVYSGYLASPEQGRLLEQTIDLIAGESTLVIVDPAMADNGKYYANLGEQMSDCFRSLMAKADVVTPNITEACFITNTEYVSGPCTMEFVEELIEKLMTFGPKIVAITGVSLEKGKVGVVAKSKANGKICVVMNDAREGMFHGAGDIFASSFAALLTRGAELETALETAEKFVADCIERTEKRGAPRHYGMDFESALPEYINSIKSIF
ncbi:MAG: pyridoxamine kinase [Bacillota bacterium]|nr:pyridoxamine kinase [Bacillota bacterium]